MNPLNTQTNKANMSALGPWLVVIALGLDRKFQWGFEEAWYAAVASVLIWVATYYVANRQRPTMPSVSSIAGVLIMVVLAATMLSGCSMVPYYSQIKAVADTGISTAIKDRMEFNDKKLAVNLSTLCDASIGAVNRYPDPQVRDFINRSCGGEPSVSIDMLARTMELLDLAVNSNQATAHPKVPPVTENPVLLVPQEFDAEEVLPPLPEDFQ